MKKYLLLIVLLIVSQLASAQAPAFSWAKAIGNSSSNEKVTGLDVDAGGNVYIAGDFKDTVDFDPSANVNNLISNGGRDIFVAKYLADGTFVWAYNLGDSGDDGATDLTVDDSLNVYISGFYNGTVDVDHGPAVHQLAVNTLDNGFFLKLNTNGDYMLSQSFSSPNVESVKAIAVDASHNIFVAGTYTQLTIVNALVPHGLDDIFLAKYSVGGNYLWAGDIGGSAADDVSSMACDASGNVYVTGSFADFDFDADPTAGVTTLFAYGNNKDSYLICVRPNGILKWSNLAGSSFFDEVGEDVVVDNLGYSTSSYRIDVFQCGSIHRNTAGAFMWNSLSGNLPSVKEPALDVDSQNNIYIAGSFSGTLNNFGFPLYSAGLNDVFIAKLDTTGALFWEFRVGSTGDDGAYEMAIGPNNTIYVAGLFSGTVDFNSTPTVNTITSNGGTDLFLVKYGFSPVGIDEASALLNYHLYPNPASEAVSVKLNEGSIKPTAINVYSIDGYLMKSVNDVNQFQGDIFTFDVKGFAAGLYFVELTDGVHKKVQKFIKCD